jgi:tetratricopeptide (TPR) repeat protein
LRSSYKKNNKKVKNALVQELFLSQFYLKEADELRNNSKFKEAIDRYLHAILINRDNPNSYIGLAISYKNLKQYNKAILNLKKAEKLQPYDTTIQKELALCNIVKGDFANGIKHLITTIRLDPNNIDAQMQLALVHEMIEEENMALMIYQKIIETNPDYIRAYIQKATLYMHLEDYLNCAKIFKKVLKFNSEYYRAYLAIGICYEKLGNIQGARRFYKKYLKYSKDVENIKEVSLRIKELNGKIKKEVNNLKLL